MQNLYKDPFKYSQSSFTKQIQQATFLSYVGTKWA